MIEDFFSTLVFLLSYICIYDTVSVYFLWKVHSENASSSL